MHEELIDSNATSRELIRRLRTATRIDGCLPESVAWQTFIELRRRGEPDANTLFIGTLRNLHSRRCIAGMDLPMDDGVPEEHRLVEDDFLGDLWKAYKKCIRNNRTGPAHQLIRDIEERINEN
ncbi:MAG: hypothetical protein KC656_11945 [Myxococcales bacterium]|nr:hypothetical protein [Myxococcales bacterium]MCB9668475.1 hypothetical protein [Alphaproteobacteria bacterium]MCB9690713.1 hypothetical protein [Alphaproteobacteria bacterium]MCB9695005.1 hypothetical protein [Alphaproteobacteria bacterium]